MKRAYGTITDEKLIDAVSKCNSVMGVLRFLGKKEAGGTHAHYSRRIKNLGIDISHFENHKWTKSDYPMFYRKTADDILILRTGNKRSSSPHLRRALLEIGREYSCEKCKQPPYWLGNPLTLDVDHINENWLDDRRENLRFLCPNCHSQFSRNLLGN